MTNFIVLAVFFVVLMPSGVAANVDYPFSVPNSCEYDLGRPNIGRVYVFENRILSTDDAIRIKKILETSVNRLSKAPNEFATGDAKVEAFREAYVEARLRPFSPKDRDNLKKAIQALKFEFNYSRKGKKAANSREIRMWRGFQDTIFPYTVLAHEIEHIIQAYQFFGVGEYYGDFAKVVQKIRVFAATRFGVKTFYKIELGAVQAEWEILNLASPSILKISQQALDSSHGYVNTYIAEVFSRAIANSKLDRDEFIRHEHVAGRYSKSFFVLHAGPYWFGTGLSLILLGNFLLR